MASFVDCPSCQLLIAASERACPFCDASLRSSGAAPRVLVGMMLGLSAMTVSCGDKDGSSTGMSTMDTELDTEGATEPTGVMTEQGSTTDPTITESDTETGDDTTTDDSTTTTTTTTTTGMSDTDMGTTFSTTTDDSSWTAGVTYGGADEVWETDPALR
ncbi:MAG: hypothetical protein R3A51_11045 [Nannocystaceae bacterium]